MSKPQDPKDDDLFEKLQLLNRLWQRHETETVSCSGLTVSECQLLRWIHTHPGAKLEQMAEAMLITRSRLTRILDGLEEKRFISREPDPADSRAVRIAISAMGQRRIEATASPQNEEWRKCLTQLPPNKQKSLLESVQFLISELEKKTSGEVQ